MNKYYAILGLPASASKDEVRRKYRQLVLVWHPDRNSSPGASEKFIQITEAYDILMGERSAPRVKTYTKSNYYGYPKPKQQKSQSGTTQERHATRAELFRKKFDTIRTEHRNHPHATSLLKGMRSKARMYFGITIGIGVMMIVIPIALGAGHLIWTIPAGVSIGAQTLWRGGRFMLRSEMIFGSKSQFTDEEIAEFFVDGIGFRSGSYKSSVWK